MRMIVGDLSESALRKVMMRLALVLTGLRVVRSNLGENL